MDWMIVFAVLLFIGLVVFRNLIKKLLRSGCGCMLIVFIGLAVIVMSYYVMQYYGISIDDWIG